MWVSVVFWFHIYILLIYATSSHWASKYCWLSDVCTFLFRAERNSLRSRNIPYGLCSILIIALFKLFLEALDVQ